MKNHISNAKKDLQSGSIMKSIGPTSNAFDQRFGDLPMEDIIEDETELDKELDKFMVNLNAGKESLRKNPSNKQPPKKDILIPPSIPVKRPVSILPPPSPKVESTIGLYEKIEQQHNRKLDSLMKSETYPNPQAPPARKTDFTHINQTLNMIKTRLMFMLSLAKDLQNSIKSILVGAVTYNMWYHSKNMTNQVLDILSRDTIGDLTCDPNWEEFMSSHDHTVQTSNFVSLSNQLHKLINKTYKKFNKLRDSKKGGSQIQEIIQVIHNPDDFELQDIAECLDMLLLGATTCIKNLAKSKDPKKKISSLKGLQVEFKLTMARLAINLGLLSDKEYYEVYNLDLAIESADKIDKLENESDLLNAIYEYDKALTELSRR